MVGCSEALSKKLANLSIKVKWKDAPSNFATHYDGYGISGVNNSYFTASVVFSDGGGWENRSEHHCSNPPMHRLNIPSHFAAPGRSSGSPGITQDGFITFSLEKDFYTPLIGRNM